MLMKLNYLTALLLAAGCCSISAAASSGRAPAAVLPPVLFAIPTQLPGRDPRPRLRLVSVSLLLFNNKHHARTLH